MIININDLIKCRLTPAGIALAAKCPHACIELDENGDVTTQLWVLMMALGPGICTGFNPLIVRNEIEILPDFLSEQIKKLAEASP